MELLAIVKCLSALSTKEIIMTLMPRRKKKEDLDFRFLTTANGPWTKFVEDSWQGMRSTLLKM